MDSCGYDKQLNDALSLAKNNRKELENVLKHYEKDSLKLEAAKFLIRNMPGYYSVDSQLVEQYTPFYDNYVTLNGLYNYGSAEWGNKVDSLWQEFSMNHSQINFEKRFYDITTLSSQKLITEIDLAFEAWQNNVYTQNCPFKDS